MIDFYHLHLWKKGFAVCHYRAAAAAARSSSSRAGIRHTEKNHAELIPKLQYTTVAYLRSRLFKTYIIVQCNRFLIASSSSRSGCGARSGGEKFQAKNRILFKWNHWKTIQKQTEGFWNFSTFFPIRPLLSCWLETKMAAVPFWLPGQRKYAHSAQLKFLLKTTKMHTTGGVKLIYDDFETIDFSYLCVLQKTSIPLDSGTLIVNHVNLILQPFPFSCSLTLGKAMS